jgi:hypothetical protein
LLPKVIDIGRILKTKSDIIILRVGTDVLNESRADIVDKLNSTGMKNTVKWLDGKFTPAELKEIEDKSLCMIVSPLPFLYFKGGFILFDNYDSNQLADIIMEER